MHHGYWNDGGDWWWIPMSIMMVAFWLGVAWVVVTLVRRSGPATGSGPGHHAPPPAVDPRQVLAERLAHGDIDIEDYRARIAELDRSLPGSQRERAKVNRTAGDR